MKRKPYLTVLIYLICTILLAGCGNSNSADADLKDEPEKISKEADMEDTEDNGKEEEKPSVKKEDKEKEEHTSAGKSLAQRMAGKYSYHYSGEDGNEEFYIMDVVPFGDNLYAFCGQAMTEDYESLEAYTFWAGEFIPYDADEMESTDGDTVLVNELCFSIMSNAGKYWNAGHKGTITLTNDGLVFEGFDHDGFLVPDYDDSRLFLKDDRVEDAFGYLRDGNGDDDLEGLWMLEGSGANVYLEFAGANLYIYRKDPGSEVFYAAGACDFSDGTFSCTTSRLGSGGMPLELSCDYKVSGDSLMLEIISSDMQDEMPENGKYTRVTEDKVHVTTMDEVEFYSDSFGMFGDNQNFDDLKRQDDYRISGE